MRKSWGQFFRRIAMACSLVIVAGNAWRSAVCYAAAAFDSASDPVYADGWQGITHAGTAGGGAQLTTGDNGGFGFTAWNFDSGYVASGNYSQPHGYNYGNYFDVGTKDIATGGPFNALGTTWHIKNIPATPPPPAKDQTGAVRAGRGFSLGVGETLKVTLDNPSTSAFFKGFFVRLNGGTGGVNGNIGNSQFQPMTVGGTTVEKALFSFFSYGTDHWFLEDAGSTDTGLTISQTAAAGVVLSVKRTGIETYDAAMHPLGGAPDFVAANRTFKNPGFDVDWLEFTFFNAISNPDQATDMYIQRMEIIPEPATTALAAIASFGIFVAAGRRKD